MSLLKANKRINKLYKQVKLYVFCQKSITLIYENRSNNTAIA